MSFITNWAPAITVSGAILAALIGQILSHRYARKREIEKQNKDSLQNLYSPLAHKIKEYLNAESDIALSTANIHIDEEYIEGMNYLDIFLLPKSNTLFKEIKEYIGENLIYANQDLIMMYEKGKGFGDYNYGEYKATELSSLATWGNRLDLCSALLEEYLSINSQLGTLSKVVSEELKGPYFFTQVMIILFSLRQFDIAISYGFRSKQVIEDTLESNSSLYKRAEWIRKQYDQFFLDYKLFENTRYDDLNVSAYEFIFDLIEEINYFESETAELWTEQIEKRIKLEDKLLQETIQKYIKTSEG